MTKHSVRLSLGRKLAALIVLMGVILSIAALTVSYRTFSASMMDYYDQLGENLVRTLASQLDPAELDHYFETSEMDDAYYQTQSFIQDLVDNNNVKYLYVVRPHGVGVTFLFDSDMEMAAGGGYAAGGYCALGTYVDLVGAFADNLDKFLQGEEVAPIIQQDDSFGWQMTAITPVLHDDGTMAGYVMADISMTDIMRTRQTFLVGLAVLLAALTACFIVLFLLFLRKTVIRPIDQLTRATGDFIHSNEAELAAGTAQVNVPEIRTGDEVEQLADAFRKMEEDMLSYIHSVMQITAEKERIGAELNVATQIQADMLPRLFPAFPSQKEFDIYATMTPAKEVGGDFYDFFLIDDDHLAIVIADVSGKGVPAALFMVIAKTLIKNHAQNRETPSAVFEHTNDQLCEGNDAGLFVTAWMGVLEISTGKFTFVNAGHNPPLLKHANGDYEWLRTKPNFVLAGMEGMHYRENVIELHPGDRLYLYTDGVTEATNSNKELYGEDRLKAALDGLGNVSCQETLAEVKKSIDAFVGDAEQFDDITMLSLEYRERGVRKTMTEQTFPAQLDQLDAVQSFVETQLERYDCPPRIRFQIDVAVEELFVNIAHYAYPAEQPGDAVIRCGVEDGQIVVQFQDRGKPFNPLEKPDADISLSADDRSIGGLGILMAKKSMDAMEYVYKDEQNLVTIRKNLTPEKPA